MRGFVAALLVLVLPAAALADPATARIGALGLAYDDARWRITGADGTYGVACIDAYCGDAAMDIAVVPDPGFVCSTETAIALARAAFPEFQRVGSNPLRIPGLHVVFASSNDRGWSLEVGWAVTACATHDGMRYSFTSRLAGPLPPYQHEGVLHEFLLGLAAPEGEPRELAVGGLSIPYLSDEWQLRLPPDNRESARLACVRVGCEDRRQPLVDIVALPEGTACPGPLYPDVDQLRGSAFESWTSPDGIAIELYAIGNMCRNLVPVRLEACAAFGDRTYHFTVPGGAACRYYSSLPDDAFRDLLAGLRPLAE